MDEYVTFARHVARLVWLIGHEPLATDEQKALLRVILMMAKTRSFALTIEDEQLMASGTAVSAAFPGVEELVARMELHALRGIGFDADAGAAELLGVARMLAAAPGAVAFTGAQRVRLQARPLPGALPELELVETIDDAIESPIRRPRQFVPDGASRAGADAGGLFGQFAPSSRTPSAPAAVLLAELARTVDLDRVDQLVEELTVLAEQSIASNDLTVAAEVLGGLVRRDAATADPSEKRLLAMSLRRVAKAPVLRTVARQLPHAGDEREVLIAVLARAGDDGIDALVEQIAAVGQQSERRVYFDTLVQLQAGVPALIHMLGDSRWFVARNAADLLGEMQAPDAEQPLTWLLQHADDRVRRSATTALMRLGTPRALQAIQEALRDGAPQVRMQAALALAARQGLRTAVVLVRALDDERDEEVQAAFLLALGRMGTADAVQRLVDAAQPERGFFRKKGTAFRVAAVQGLVEARTPAAVAGLEALSDDRDSEVRDAVRLALSRIARCDAAKGARA